MIIAPRGALPAREIARWWSVGLWMRLALVGVAVAIGGVALFADPDTPLATAVLTTLGGAALAVLAWRRMVRGIDGADESASEAQAHTTPIDRPRGARAAISPSRGPA